MFWVVCVLFIVIPFLMASSIKHILSGVIAAQMHRATRTVPLKSRLSVLIRILKEGGNFSMPDELFRLMSKEQFENGMGHTLIRSFREQGLVCNGNGCKQLNVTEAVPSEFGVVWLCVMKDENYEIASANSGCAKPADDEVLEQIAEEHFGYRRDDPEAFTEKISNLRKILKGLDIVVRKKKVAICDVVTENKPQRADVARC